MAAKKKAAAAPAPAPVEKDSAREASMVANVLKAPDDDAPRLVFADWLTEHGDPRGEFIQLQCELKRPVWGSRPIIVPKDATSRAAQLTAREQALLKKHAKEWLEPVRAFIRVWSWARGFLAQVHVNASFFNGATELLTRHPVGPLCFEGLKAGDIERFASVELPHLTHLDVTGAPFSEKNIHHLFGKNLAGIEVLHFHGSMIGKTGVTRLVKESQLQGLKKLGLGSCGVSDEGIAALATLKKLEWLNLSTSQPSPEGAMALLESKSLKTLKVDDYFAKAAGAEAMKALGKKFELLMQ